MSEPTAAGVVQIDDTLEWSEAEIPHGSAPVLVARLRKDPTGALSLAVRFPRGWERPVAGHYGVEETFVVLEGAIELNGRRYGEGQLVVAPSRATRSFTATPEGALTVARFAGPPRWSDGAAGDGGDTTAGEGEGSAAPGEGEGSVAGGGRETAAGSGAASGAIVSFDTGSLDSAPANGRSLLRQHEDGSTTWLAASATAGRARSATEVVLPRSFGWTFVEADGALPALAEPVVLREACGEA